MTDSDKGGRGLQTTTCLGEWKELEKTQLKEHIKYVFKYFQFSMIDETFNLFSNFSHENSHQRVTIAGGRF